MFTAVSPDACASARVRASMVSWSLVCVSWPAAEAERSAFGLSRAPRALTIGSSVVPSLGAGSVLVARKFAPALDDAADAAQVLDVGERVLVEDDEVRQLAGL